MVTIKSLIDLFIGELQKGFKDMNVSYNENELIITIHVNTIKQYLLQNVKDDKTFMLLNMMNIEAHNNNIYIKLKVV